MVFKTVLSAAVLVLLPALAQAQTDPMAEICHVRAKKYSGADGVFSYSDGRFSARVSGEIGVGVTSNSTAQGANSISRDPGFAGAADTERRRKQTAEDRYRRTYDDCMRDR